MGPGPSHHGQAPPALAGLFGPAAVRFRRGMEGQRDPQFCAADLRAQRLAARTWLLCNAGDPACGRGVGDLAARGMGAGGGAAGALFLVADA